MGSSNGGVVGIGVHGLTARMFQHVRRSSIDSSNPNVLDISFWRRKWPDTFFSSSQLVNDFRTVDSLNFERTQHAGLPGGLSSGWT